MAKTPVPAPAASPVVPKAAEPAPAPGPFEKMQGVVRWQIRSTHAALDVKRGKTANDAFEVWKAHCGHSVELAESLVKSGGVVLKDYDDGGREYTGGKLARLLGLRVADGESTPDAAGS